MESESDEEPVAEEPCLRGALRGLDMGNMLAPPDTRHSPDASEDGRQSMATHMPQHETRASRHGKAPVNYSAKWHPMDEVMRPKRARALASGSTSRRRANDSDDGEPEPFSGGDTSDEDDEDETPDTSFEREPDTKATRRSARPEALKPVNYSKTHHPQDHLLPGYRNKAKRRRRSTSATQPRKRKASSGTVVLSSQTIADSDGDSSDADEGNADEDDCMQLQAAEPATTTTSSPREQPEHQSARKNRAMPPDVAEDSHHILDAVPSLLRGESSFGPVVQGLLHQIDGSALDSQQSSQAVNHSRNRFDDDMAGQSTEALIAGATAFIPIVEDPAAITSDQVASEHVQEGAPVPGEHSDLRVSRHATVRTSLLTPSSAMDKSTQAGSLGLTIARPYSTPQVEPSVKCQPSSSSQSKDAEVSELDVPPSDDDRQDVPVRPQERSDTLNDQDHPNQTRRHGSSDAVSRHGVPRTEQAARGFSDLSSRADLASHDPGDRMIAMSPASRQASRETNPEDVLRGESFFYEATSSSQISSKGVHEEDATNTCSVALPKLLESGQQQNEGNFTESQLPSGGQPLVSAGGHQSHPSDNGPQDEVEPEVNQVSGPVPQGIQSPPATSVPADALTEAIASSSTEVDDNLLLAGSGM
jgi:hypothetical protein